MDANQNRREFKFVLPPHLQGVLRARVAEMMEADRGAEDGYPVLSEYFDTEERSSYWQKQMGVQNRRRIRSRVYGRRDGAIPASGHDDLRMCPRLLHRAASLLPHLGRRTCDHDLVLVAHCLESCPDFLLTGGSVPVARADVENDENRGRIAHGQTTGSCCS